MSVVGIQRALIILKQMAASQNGSGVRELARDLGYSPAVVQKCLQALVSQEFATQDPVTQHYHLGPAALQVGLAGLGKLEIRRVARPCLEALAQNTGETALLGVSYGHTAIYVDKVLSPAEIRADAMVGARRPFNCTAVGKALLAYMPDEELDRLAAEGALVRATPRSITDLAALRLELARIRERGLAVDYEEFMAGVMCMAAPIRNHDGHIVGALSISGPAPRVQARQHELEPVVIAAARDLSASMGYLG